LAEADLLVAIVVADVGGDRFFKIRDFVWAQSLAVRPNHPEAHVAQAAVVQYRVVVEFCEVEQAQVPIDDDDPYRAAVKLKYQSIRRLLRFLIVQSLARQKPRQLRAVRLVEISAGQDQADAGVECRRPQQGTGARRHLA
jgi:hypothetical protein